MLIYISWWMGLFIVVDFIVSCFPCGRGFGGGCVFLCIYIYIYVVAHRPFVYRLQDDYHFPTLSRRVVCIVQWSI